MAVIQPSRCLDGVSETAVRRLRLQVQDLADRLRPQVQDIIDRLLLRVLPEIRLPEIRLPETLFSLPELRSVAPKAQLSIRQMLTAAKETEKALTGLPKRTQGQLTVITVRCPANSLLLRVMRIPDHLPGSRYARHLVLPTSAATYETETEHPGEQMDTRAWFLDHHDDPFNLRCRCHPGVTLTPEQLRGESPPPLGIRVLKS